MLDFFNFSFVSPFTWGLPSALRTQNLNKGCGCKECKAVVCSGGRLKGEVRPQAVSVIG